VRDHERRQVEPGDDVGHRKGLARSGNAHQRLVLLTFAQTACELLNSLRLVARRLERDHHVSDGFATKVLSHEVDFSSEKA